MAPRPSLETINYVENQPFFVRDYVLEGDDNEMRATMSRIAHQDESIRMHNEALQAIEDAALARALELSKETALEEARRRYHQAEAHIPDHTLPSHSPSNKQTTQLDKTSSLAMPSSVTIVRSGINQEKISVQSSSASMTWGEKNQLGRSTSTSSSQSGPNSQEKIFSYSVPSRRSDNPAPNLGSRTDRINSTKDVHHRQNHDLTPNSDYQLDSRHNISQALLVNVRSFVPPQKCYKCGTLVERVQNNETVAGLHAICTKCKSLYCRGCFLPKNCLRGCPGGARCAVENCCPGIRAIAAFDALSDFNNAFAAAVHEHRRLDNPYGCITTLLREKDASVRQFERSFINTLHKLPPLLRPLSADLHPPIAGLVFESLLPQVIYGYLKHEDVGDWVMHSEAYLAILEALKEFPSCGLGSVSLEPFVCHGQSGVPLIPRADEEAGDTQWCCVEDAVKHLGAHQKRLSALSSRITFPATLLKVHKLSDGILYLLLQQVFN